MNYTEQWSVDESGILYWRAGLSIVDEELKAAYRMVPQFAFACEQFAVMGVMIGAA